MGRAPCCDKVGLKKGPWTPEEDQVLINFIHLYGHSNWRALPKQAGNFISTYIFHFFYNNTDANLINYLVQLIIFLNFVSNAGLLRCGKSCRLRWINYLKPDIKRGNFSREEEDTIIQLHEMMGNRYIISLSS